MREDKMLSRTISREKWIVVIVAFAMLMLAPVQSWVGAGGTAKAAEKGKYVSEVYTAYGKDEAAARKVLEDNGYTPVEGNLNAKTKTYVMLGYKTTDDKSKAVRDIALMNSKGEYSVGDYENMLKEKKAEIAAYLKGFMNMVKEYRANYAKNDGQAILVHETLNNFIEDDSGMGMGDLLLGDTLQDKVGIEESITDENKEKLPDLVTIFMQGNSMNLNTIVTDLGMATGKAGDSLVDEFAETTNEDLKEELEKKNPDMSEAKQEQQLKGRYEEAAKLLAAEAKLMAEELKEYEKSELNIEKADAKDIEEELGDTEKIESAEDMKKMNEDMDWASTTALYEALKNYEGGQFKKGELLDFIMETEENDDPERFYPLVASFTKGESFAKANLSLKAMLLGDMADDKEMKETAKDDKEDIKKIENVSVYEGVDRDVYLTDGSVALTDEAKRKNAAALAVDQNGKPFWDTFAVAAASSWVLTGAALVACLKSNPLTKYENIVQNVLYNFSEKKAIMTHTPYQKLNPKDVLKEYGSFEKAFREQTKNLVVDEEGMKVLQAENVTDYFDNEYRNGKYLDKQLRIHNIFKYATIALALISAGLTIAALLSNDEADLPPVPKYMVDSKEGQDGKRQIVNYLAALSNGLTAFKADKKNKGPFADTKAYEGWQWLVIYQAKDDSAGLPVTPDFVVQSDKEAPSGYDGALHLIGENGAANLVNTEYMNYSKYEKLKNKDGAVYVFFKTSEDEGTASAFSGGMLAIIIIGALAVIALIAVLVRRSKKKSVTV
jgi:hypothetical protein